MEKINNFSNYYIDENGNLWSQKSKRYLKPTVDKYGYLDEVLVNDEGKRQHLYIHRVVAETYIPNPNGYTVVHHKDENKLNNSVSNLE